MTWFGVIVSPGRAYTLPTAPGASGSLHLTQVSLDDGSDDRTVALRVTPVDKTPIIIARLLPRHSESLHLDLRFSLSQEVTFSVLGPRKVHLAGYFGGLPDSTDSESFGEDIAHSDSYQKSGDDSEYGGSFINDSDPDYSSPSSADSSFKANGHPVDQKMMPKEKKSSRRRLRKVHVVESNSDSSGTSEGCGTVAVVPDSDEDFDFHENSLLKRKLRGNGSGGGDVQKSVSLAQETRTSEGVNQMAEKSVVPDTNGSSISSPSKQSAKMKESVVGSTKSNSRTPIENGTAGGAIRPITVVIDLEAGKAASPPSMKVETASEPMAKKKKKKCVKKVDLSQTNDNEQRHEAIKPEPVTLHSPKNSEEVDVGLKVMKKKKKKKQVKDELGGMGESSKGQASGAPNAVDTEKQLAGLECLKAGEPDDDTVLQFNESVKDDVSRSKKGKRKKYEENDAVATQPSIPLPTPAQSMPGKPEDESKKEKKNKKQREK